MNTKNKVYGIITDRILDALKSGVAPWHKPWRISCYGKECGSSFNLKTKKAYRGLNTIILANSGFSSPFWVSYKQATSMGGTVKKGSKGTPVIFWKILEIEENKDGATRTKKIPFLRYSTVFNVEQCEGLDAKVPQPEVKPDDFNPIDVADAVIENMPKRPEILHGGGAASYSPGLDRVRLPKPEQFDTPDHYYSTAFHELAHSTGHECRLSRKGVAGTDGNWSPFDSPEYAKEELVAEMTAAFLCGETGIEGAFNESASYIEHWRKHISDDPTLIVHAASAAQKAADFILGKLKTTADEDEAAAPAKTEQDEVAA